MSNVDVVRAWRDPQYRRGLSGAQIAGLPQHPAGSVRSKPDNLAQMP